jgi:hypothetical protein
MQGFLGHNLTLSSSSPIFQIVAGDTKRKKHCMQVPSLKKKAHNWVTMKDIFDEDQQQYTLSTNL